MLISPVMKQGASFSSLVLNSTAPVGSSPKFILASRHSVPVWRETKIIMCFVPLSSFGLGRQ